MWEDNDLVFPNEFGGFMRPDKVRDVMHALLTSGAPLGEPRDSAAGPEKEGPPRDRPGAGASEEAMTRDRDQDRARSPRVGSGLPRPGLEPSGAWLPCGPASHSSTSSRVNPYPRPTSPVATMLLVFGSVSMYVP